MENDIDLFERLNNMSFKERLESIIKDAAIERNNQATSPYKVSMTYDYDYLEKLVEEFSLEFPGVRFQVSDINSLITLCQPKEKINRNIYNHEHPVAYGQKSYYSTSEEYEKDKERQATVNDEYQQAFDAYVGMVEKLSDEEQINSPSYDIEQEVFQPIYTYSFGLRPRNKILRNFYETYADKEDKSKRVTELEEDNTKLQETNTSLEEQNNSLQTENVELTNKVSRLQKMLQKTIQFCDTVKRSRFGRFFFGKQIKALPAPEEDLEK